jgi:short subunit dehydrogenase-like uncharacterized protein
VVRACRDAGVHYMDTTGEQDWMRFLEEKYGPAFKDRDLLLCPANAWMWTAGELAAEVALETSGVDTLDIAYMGDSNTSVASTMSFLRMCCTDQYYLKSGMLEVWPHARAYEVSIPGDHRIYRALPWGGAGEPVWRRLDSRVRNCSVLVAFKNQDVMDWIVGRIKDWYDNYRGMPREEFERMSNGWGNALVNTEPAREVREENRSVVCCHARGNTRSTTVVLRGNSPYVQAGVWAAESVSRLISGRLRATGFASPSRAFGHRELLAAAAEGGYLGKHSDLNLARLPRRSGQQRKLSCRRDRLHAVTDGELGIDVLEVKLHRVLRHEDPLGHLAVGSTIDQVGEDVLLAFSQRL